jgi:ChaB
MPYKRTPKRLAKSMTKKGSRTFRKVFNAVIKQKGKTEKDAFRIAHAAVNKSGGRKKRARK